MRRPTSAILARAAATLALAAIAFPAQAHHPLGGAPMASFSDGLLSGVGHPILGFDHLFFVVAVGIAACFTGRPLTAPLAFVAAMLAGVGLAAAGLELPVVEPVIVASLLVLGGLIARGRPLAPGTAAALFAGLGLFHGLAFGAALGGVEAAAAVPVTLGYLAGLGVTQWAVAVGAGLALTRLWNARTADALPARIAGGAVAGAGALLALELAEGAAFAALGWG